MKDPKARPETQLSEGHHPSTEPSPMTSSGHSSLFGDASERIGTAAEAIGPNAAPGIARDQRRDPRTSTFLSVSTTTVDPVRNQRTGEVHYETYEAELITNLSRRGLGLRCARPPTVGSRLLLQIRIYDEPEPIELIGRTCWTRVEILRGVRGRKRAVAAVGLELLGGSRGALERYDRALARIGASKKLSVATPAGLR